MPRGCLNALWNCRSSSRIAGRSLVGLPDHCDTRHGAAWLVLWAMLSLVDSCHGPQLGQTSGLSCDAGDNNFVEASSVDNLLENPEITCKIERIETQVVGPRGSSNVGLNSAEETRLRKKTLPLSYFSLNCGRIFSVMWPGATMKALS
ncbi:hypothetical protein ACJRO7_018134 [Eucalyptus globulus]|uniref:Uncharacterized protein n=1 Tax=Eucalyptus globulus TaxID=34317 RepID=A0ABD3KTS0_EUCGL